MHYVTPGQMRELERRTDAAGISYWQMMQNAGRALADCILSRTREGSAVAFLAGNGNNGGDCYVCAALLHQMGRKAAVFAPFGSPKTDISRMAAQMAADIPAADADFLNRADVLVDGLFGTGFHGSLPEGVSEILRIRRSGQLRIACDIPSGGNGSTGSADEGTFKADLTVTFGAAKLGLAMYPLRSFCGEVEVVDIGIPASAFEGMPVTEALTLQNAQEQLPCRPADSYKNRNGHLLAVTGSVRMRGACVLAAGGALRSGIGLLTTAAPPAALNALSFRYPESMCLPLMTDAEGFSLCDENRAILEACLDGKSALLIGCGMGCTENTRQMTKNLLNRSECPVILDADGLNVLKGCIEWIPEGRTILTPHPAEAARLLGISAADVQRDRLAAVLELSRKTGSIVILKGAGTLVSDGIRTAICTLGNPGMARAGNGDVLAGITASLAAQGLPLYEAACTAVTLHSAAGDACGLPERFMLPSDLTRALKMVL